MKKYIKNIVLALLTLLIIAGIWSVWSRLASPTKIALVNFQPFQTASIVKANSDRFIEYEDVSVEDLGRLGRYDFVLGFGMGMRISIVKFQLKFNYLNVINIKDLHF